MGKYKKEAVRKDRQGKTGDGMANVKTKGENFYRDAKKVKRLNILKEGKAQRNAEGKITKAASYQSRDKPVARIEPNRKWFGNTRVIAQDALAKFRDAVAQQQSDPYSYLLKQNKLPMSLIRDGQEPETKNGVKVHAAKVAVEQAPFNDTFGPKSRRKRVKMDVSSLEDLAGKSGDMLDQYREKKEQERYLSGGGDAEERADDVAPQEDGTYAPAREAIFSKGQSKRIWNELYKVVDSSDVLIQVLDARDPEGTRCRHIEKYIKAEAPHKHVLLVLNKCDLIPTKIAAQWVRLLSKEYPTLAFHSSITNSFGKGSLIQLLRQFSTLHAHRKQVSVGFIGYPNVGKSSIINTLRKKKVCKTAPVPGETKVWQYITLMRRIFLIDCPGIVPPSQTDTDSDVLLRGAVRVEVVEQPAQYVPAALERCARRHVDRTYGVANWKDATELLERIAQRSGRLRRGGEPDVEAAARVVLRDFLRGRLPWYVPPPGVARPGEGAKRDVKFVPATAGDDAAVLGQEDGQDVDEDDDEERPGTLGDMARLNKLGTQALRKRKRDEERGADDGDDDEDDTSVPDDDDDEDGSSASNEFASFSSESEDDDAEDDEDKMIDSRSVTATEATTSDGGGVDLSSGDE